MLCRTCMQKMHASSELESSDVQRRSGGFEAEGGAMRGAVARVVSGVDVAVRARALDPRAGKEAAHSERRQQGTKMVALYPARSLPSGSPLVECAGRKGGGRWYHAEHGKPAKVAASNLTCGRSRTHKGA